MCDIGAAISSQIRAMRATEKSASAFSPHPSGPWTAQRSMQLLHFGH